MEIQRRTSFATASVAVFTVMIVFMLFFGTRAILDRALEHSIMAKAESRAAGLGRQIETDLSDYFQYSRNHPASANYLAELNALSRGGEQINRLRLFNSKGFLTFSFERGDRLATEPAHLSSNIQDAMTLGHAKVSVFESERTMAGLGTFAHAAIPVRNEDGTVIAGIVFIFDHTDTANVFAETFDWLVFALPLLVALSYFVPATAWVVVQKRSQRQRDLYENLERCDRLTGLLNRASFSAETRRLLDEENGTHVPTGLLILDIDRFSQINDMHGHDIADAFLGHVGRTIQGAVRSNDIVARFGADEFGVLLPDVAEFELASIANRILLRMGEPFRKDGKKVSAAACIGTYLTEPGDTLDEAMHAVELAQAHAKETGLNTVTKYSYDLDASRRRRRMVESALRDAWETGRAKLVFQPVVGTRTGKIEGFEALMRLNTHDGTSISPEEFIQIAEQNGMIHDLGLEALRVAMKTALDWPTTTFVAVNMSPAQFRKGNLVQKVNWLLEELSFPPERLELEITESLLLDDEPGVQEQFQGLKELGVSIAMDDFGTGHSSLSHLIEHDFDKLKIDRVFLAKLDEDPERHTNILQSIVTLGRHFGMKVTMEGIETPAHVDLLTTMGCDLLQGFHFSKPVPAKEIAPMFEHRKLGGVA